MLASRRWLTAKMDKRGLNGPERASAKKVQYFLQAEGKQTVQEVGSRGAPPPCLSGWDSHLFKEGLQIAQVLPDSTELSCLWELLPGGKVSAEGPAGAQPTELLGSPLTINNGGQDPRKGRPNSLLQWLSSALFWQILTLGREMLTEPDPKLSRSKARKGGFGAETQKWIAATPSNLFSSF